MSTGCAFKLSLKLQRFESKNFFSYGLLKLAFSDPENFPGLSRNGPLVAFLERPGNFSDPKSHFKNHEALDVKSFSYQQVLHLSKPYTYAAFRI